MTSKGILDGKHESKLDRYSMERRWLLNAHLDAVGEAELGSVDAAVTATATGMLLAKGVASHTAADLDSKGNWSLKQAAMVEDFVSETTKPQCVSMVADVMPVRELAEVLVDEIWRIVLQLRVKVGASK